MATSSLGKPAVIFEEAHGVTGIAGRYLFPAGMSQDALQQRIWDSKGLKSPLAPQVLTSLWDELKQLNPEQTAKIHFNPQETEELRNVIHGMVSGFNPDDINLFMKRAHGSVPLSAAVHMAEEIERKAYEVKIVQRLKNTPSVGWIASPPTLDRIWEQVKDRPVVTTFERAIEAVKNNPAGWIAGLGLLAVGSYAVWREYDKRHRTHVMASAAEKLDKENAPTSYVAAYLDEKKQPPGEAASPRL